MRVLVTGCTASQTRRHDSVAGYIAEALEYAGHHVDVQKPSLTDVLEDNVLYDHVIVGLGPLHGLGTSSMYGALGLIGKYWGNGLTLYLDDIDSGKIHSGMKGMISERGLATNKLVKPFYSYKREHKIASDPDVTRWLREVITVLLEAGESHPSMITPSFTYDQGFRTAFAVSRGAGMKVLPIDFTSFVPALTRPQTTDDPPVKVTTDSQPWWTTEAPVTSPRVRNMGPFTWEVYRVKSSDVDLFFRSSGYLSPSDEWHLKIRQFPLMGKPVIVPWRSFAYQVDEAFEVLASTVEVMPERDRADLADAQLMTLTSYCPSQDDVAKQLDNEVTT